MQLRIPPVVLVVVLLATPALAGAEAPTAPDAADLYQKVYDTAYALHRAIEDGADDALDLEASDPSGAVALATIDKGYYPGYIHRAFSVVDNAAEWATLWTHHGSNRFPTPVLPDVDFATEMVLVAYLGQSPCAGDTIRISSVKTRVVSASDALNEPPLAIAKKGAPLTTVYLEIDRKSILDYTFGVYTNPYHIVKVPRIEGPVAFVGKHPAGDLADYTFEAAALWWSFCMLPFGTGFVDYRTLDAGVHLGVDVVPGPASTLPLLGTGLAEPCWDWLYVSCVEGDGKGLLRAE